MIPPTTDATTDPVTTTPTPPMPAPTLPTTAPAPPTPAPIPPTPATVQPVFVQPVYGLMQLVPESTATFMEIITTKYDAEIKISERDLMMGITRSSNVYYMLL